jgi:hypothetical protein
MKEKSPFPKEPLYTLRYVRTRVFPYATNASHIAEAWRIQLRLEPLKTPVMVMNEAPVAPSSPEVE